MRDTGGPNIRRVGFPMAVCLLGLGANLDDRQHQLDTAVAQLSAHPAISVRSVSRWRQTPPIGGPAGQADFLNGAVLLETSLSAAELFRVIQSIEQSLGRQRRRRWDARRIDIDILLYEGLVCQTDELQLPHPWMAVRRFVLEPAAEIAPELRHPVLGWTVGQLARHLATVPPRFALTGNAPTDLLAALASRAGASLVVDPLVGGETTAAKSTRPTCGQQLEFLQQRRQTLSKPDWTRPARAVISQFWLEESRLAGQASLSGSEWQAFQAQFEAQTAAIPPPKLLIIWLAQGAPRLAAQVPLPPDDYRQLVKQHLQSLNLFPSVEITAADSRRFLQEAAAAVKCMQ